MKFNSKSVLLQDGVQVRIDVYIPSLLMDYSIPDDVWQAGIDRFNKILDNRPSVTQKINGVIADVLKVESIAEEVLPHLRMGAIILSVVVAEKDVMSVSDIHFCLTGQLVFKDGSDKEVEEIIIKNITYGGSDSKAFKILPEIS